MATQLIDGSLFNQMVNAGAHHLMNDRDIINELNVFPVPDGDTGTNMSLSMTSGVNEMKKINSNRVYELSNAFAKGLLMGARGNSGVILSQLFRGFAENINNKDSINTQELAEALQAGVNKAYQSVTNPVEGTILTVAKDVANEATKISEHEKDVTNFMRKIVEEAKQSLNRTPSLLPILQEVGVVDSGGKGLLTIYEGFLAAIQGEPVERDINDESANIDQLIENEHDRAVQAFFDVESIEYGYCTEFIVEFEREKLVKNPFDEATFRHNLSEYGDSLLVAADESLMKVHIHTEYPGKVMTLSQQFGSLINIDIENMRKQYEAIVKEQENDEQETDCAIVAVASGSGIIDMFKSLGTTHIVEGGQTMNPSTEDLLRAIDKTNAKQVFILPNNKNIILAAEQVTQLTDKQVTVIPTRSIQQGLSTLFEYDGNVSSDKNKENMIDVIDHVKAGSITYAIRDTVIDNIQIKQNDFIGITDDKIKVSHPEKIRATEQLLDELIDLNEDEILTVFIGEDVTDEEREQFRTMVETKFDEIEIELHDGNQAVYSFLFMVE